MDISKYLIIGDGLSDSIFTAALKNDVKFIIEYYENGGEMEVVDERNQSLLHLACRNKSLDALKILLYFGMNPNHQDKFMETPLHISSFMGSTDLVNTLLDNGANPNIENSTGQTAIHKASFKGSVPTLQALVENGADIFAVDENCSTPIQFAVRSKKIKSVKYLVSIGAIINSLDIRMQSTMHYAAIYSRVDIVNYLIKLGVNPYTKDQYKLTPLHLSVEHPQIEMSEVFLKYGLTSYDKNKFDHSPYDLAIQKFKYEAIELFDKLKNDHLYQANIKQNELTFSIIRNEFDRSVSLASHMNVNQKDIFGNTALFYAIMNNEPYLVETLLKNDADVNSIDQNDGDAIYYAVIIRNLEIIKLIAPFVTDFDKKFGGNTVLEYASKMKVKDIYKQLLSITSNSSN